MYLATYSPFETLHSLETYRIFAFILSNIIKSYRASSYLGIRGSRNHFTCRLELNQKDASVMQGI